MRLCLHAAIGLIHIAVSAPYSSDRGLCKGTNGAFPEPSQSRAKQVQLLAATPSSFRRNVDLI